MSLISSAWLLEKHKKTSANPDIIKYRPKCVVCSELLNTESLKPSKQFCYCVGLPLDKCPNLGPAAMPCWEPLCRNPVCLLSWIRVAPMRIQLRKGFVEVVLSVLIIHCLTNQWLKPSPAINFDCPPWWINQSKQQPKKKKTQILRSIFWVSCRRGYQK